MIYQQTSMQVMLWKKLFKLHNLNFANAYHNGSVPTSKSKNFINLD